MRRPTLAQPLTLYGMSSPNVRKVVIALEEIGLRYRTRHVAVFRGRQFDEEFLSLNPMAKVPVITDPDGPAGGVPIFESGAILIYLAESYAPQFLPAEGAGRWDSEMPGIEYAAGRARRAVAQLFGALERRLGEAPWLGGAAYSVADMATFPWAVRLRRYGMDADRFPHLMDWRARIEARPAVARAHAAMQPWADQDTADRAAATREESERFLGLHIDAPSAQAAAAHNGRIKTAREGEGNG
jgi:GSH-dependent disulfide-bond oxidoreductase